MGEEETEASGRGFQPPLLARRYVVHSRLGRGATSGVYLVYDLKLHAWRAAKVMHPQEATDAELRERFAREGIVMAQIDHPNVVRVVDVAVEASLPFLILEYLPGGTPVEYVKHHGAMHPALAVGICLDLCEGLGALHDIGGVHRDVKPHNLLLSHDGRAKLTDFGVARLGAPGTSDATLDELDSLVTQVGTVMGTVGYMAPEQQVDSSSVGLAADVYGVGATLFTLLTARSAADLAVTEINDPRLEVMDRRLAEFILHACSFRPSERPQDTRELARALRGIDVPRVPVGTPALGTEVRALPSRPSPRIDGSHIRGLSDLITGGAIEAVWDGSTTSTSASSLVPRTKRPPLNRQEARWSAPAPADQERTQLFAPSPHPEEQTVNLKLEVDTGGQLVEPSPAGPKRATDIKASRTGPPTVIRAPREARGSWAQSLGFFVALGAGIVMAIGFVAAVGSLALARGARSLANAERTTLHAEERMTVLIEHHQPVVSDLARLGADRSQLEAALAAYQTASADEQPALADAYVVLLLETWGTVHSDPAVAPATVGAMADLQEAWHAYGEAREAWHQTATSWTGGAAVAFGLATEPTR